MIPTSDIEADPRLKFLLFGAAGVGKTMASIQMPRPYVIDTEKGAVHYKDIIKERGGNIFYTISFKKVIDAVQALANEKHEFKTLVIDPFTTLYEMAVDEAEVAVGAKFGRHINEANKQAKRLYNILSQLDMNIAVTSHSKRLYGDKMEVIGQTFDGWKKLDYLFDLVFELDREANGKRFANVRKTRLPEFPDQMRFEWSYESLAQKYGRERLEKDAAPVTIKANGNANAELVQSIEANRDKLRDLRETYDHLLTDVQKNSIEERLTASVPQPTEELTTMASKLDSFVKAVQSAMAKKENEESFEQLQTMQQEATS